MLAFQAERFAWQPHERTRDDADAIRPGDELPRSSVANAVVAFVHAEKSDFDTDRHDSVFRGVLKHLKWLANKRELRTIVLHSFTHLGGDSADAPLARQFLVEMADRLRSTDYVVHVTPFGWMNAWEIAVFGESLAKVFKSW